ncbi:MAG: PIN domain-containing protein [Phycisphaerae bacterium]
MSQAVRVDANVILRFLRNDDPTLSLEAGRLFQKGAQGGVRLYITAVTFSEVFFALTSFYKLSSAKAAEVLLDFLRSAVAVFEHDSALADALERVMAHAVDFGDAFLAATATQANDLVATFDRDFQKFKDVRLFDLKNGS